MVQNDLEYILELFHEGVIQSPCLECGIGSDDGYLGSNFKSVLSPLGVKVIGTDASSGSQVEVLVDLQKDWQEVESAFKNVGPFKTIIIANVLEHVFDPITVIDNLLRLLSEEGNLIIVAPSVWPLHGFPIDTWRINPNFYEEYSKRRKIQLIEKYFKYMGGPLVMKQTDPSGAYCYPYPWKNSFQKWRGKIANRLLNTFGRRTLFESWIGVGVVFKKPVGWQSSGNR